jgi:Ca2+-binding RTX toxin-like protein
VNLSGNFANSLNLDLSGGLSDLGGVNNFRIFISQDDGLTESSQVYQNSIFKTVNMVDATGLTSSVKTFSFSTAPSGMTVLAPNVPSILKSGGGNNVLTGGSSNDTLIAGSGVDILNGGLGNDTLVAGLNTTMTGGVGNDTFVFPSITTLVSGRSSIVITDFGNGADILNLAPVVGNQGTTKAATAIVGSSARGTGFVNTAGAVDGAVFLVYNTGQWVDEASNVNFGFRTKQQIANLFTTPSPISGITNPVTFTKAPTVGQTYFVFVYDPPANNGASAFSGVEIWMINNLAPLAMVDSSECTLIGQMTNYGNLWSAINSTGSIAL